MKKLNSYYLISIITLVLMAFIFARMQQQRIQSARRTSAAQYLIHEYTGSYTSSTRNVDYEFQLLNDSSGTDSGWTSISRNGEVLLHCKLSDFEDDQILAELFRMDARGDRHRLESCELLLASEDTDHTGSTIGEMCSYSDSAQTYQKLKISLANPHVRVDIERWNTETATPLNTISFSLEKEVTE